MDNHVVVGVGNIYANEALFKAGILPTKPANQVTAEQISLLVNQVKLILAAAIKQGGTTLKDFSAADGKPGYFAQQLLVYGRGGQACVNCQSTLSDIKIEGHKYAGGYISHEKSNQQVMVYEGTFTGNPSGIINIARVGTGQNDSLFALMKFTGDTMLFTGHGFNEDSVRLRLYSYYGEMKFVAPKIPASGTETIDGTWFFDHEKGGSFSVKRTY